MRWSAILEVSDRLRNRNLRRRSKFTFSRRSVAFLMVGRIIDLDLKPMCLIKPIVFLFKILNNPIPDPNPKPNPYQNHTKVK